MIPKVIPAGIYKHYKGNYYMVLGLARSSEDDSQYIVYIPLYLNKEFTGPKMTVRPAQMFFEDVLVNGKKVPRFKYMGTDLDNS